MSKINYKKIYIYYFDVFFQIKNILKNNHYHNLNHFLEEKQLLKRDKI